MVFSQNWVTAHIDISDVEAPTIVEWSVSSSYEKRIGEELLVYAFDFAPDNDLCVVYLVEEERA